jgi:hypothetical protein
LAAIVQEKPPILLYPGESWVNAFLILIPKPVWRDRPTGLSQRYVAWASPSFARDGGGYAFNAAAEGYVNMGLAGTAIEVSAFTTLFFFFPIALCVGKSRGPLFLALSSCLTSFAYNQFRGEFASILKISVAFLTGAGFVLLATAIFVQLRDRSVQNAPKDFRARLGGHDARYRGGA